MIDNAVAIHVEASEEFRPRGDYLVARDSAVVIRIEPLKNRRYRLRVSRDPRQGESGDQR
nr:hypothetical protein SHINE37_70275 [Rhizobiaceae bacterium]